MKINEIIFYRRNDEGGSGGTGIPAAPAVTEAPTGSTTDTGIPASLPVSESDVAASTEEGQYKFSVNDEKTMGYDDIPMHVDDDEEAAADAATAAPAADEEVVADDATGEDVVTEEPTTTAPVVSEAAVKALKAAADAMGITETDPDKMLAAIEARQAEVAAEQQRVRETAEAAFEQQAIVRLQDAANQEVIALINPLVRAQLIQEDFPLDEAPDGWWDTASPNYDSAMTSRYNQIYNELRAQPRYQSAYDNAFKGHKATYEGEKAAIAEFATKYPNHAVELVSDLRQAGATVGFMERIAHVTDQAVTKAIAMSHSAIAAKDAELETLRAQVTGHADAIAKAKAEGLAEGRKAALVLAKGASVPNTVGVGAIAPAPYKYNPNRELTWDDIPIARKDSF